VRHLLQAVVESEECVEGNQTLVIHYGTDSPGKLLVRTPAVLTILGGAGQQIDNLIWVRCSSPAAANRVDCKEARAASKSWIEEETLEKGRTALLPRSIQDMVGICPWRANICQSPMSA
jgi:hypothetical protein